MNAKTLAVLALGLALSSLAASSFAGFAGLGPEAQRRLRSVASPWRTAQA